MFDSDQDRIEEEKHFRKIVSSFLEYQKHSLEMMTKKKRDFSDVSNNTTCIKSVTAITDLFARKMRMFEDCVRVNYAFISDMLDDLHADECVTEADMEKVRSTIRQFVRDWSENGRLERERTYGPIIDAIEEIYGNVSLDDKGKIKVLVPGAGLGRLVYEIVRKGYSCQGNEFSFHMLIGSNFVLNRYTTSHSNRPLTCVF
jgi:carnosine N-methyltransferase